MGNSLKKFILVDGQSLSKNHVSNQLDKGYRLMHELSYEVEKKFWLIFVQKKGPLPKKSRTFLHQSIAHVELIRNVLFSNFF
jgi:hypothetical protein